MSNSDLIRLEPGSDTILGKLLTLAQSLKIEVLTFRFLPPINGIWCIVPIDGAPHDFIVVHPDLTFDEMRFVLAHEIGHAVLHRNNCVSFHSKSPALIVQEQEADLFATALLALLTEGKKFIDKKIIRLKKAETKNFNYQFNMNFI